MYQILCVHFTRLISSYSHTAPLSTMRASRIKLLFSAYVSVRRAVKTHTVDRAINTCSPLVSLAACLLLPVSVGLQQHDVSVGSEHSLTSVTVRGGLWGEQTATRAGHQHSPLQRRYNMSLCSWGRTITDTEQRPRRSRLTSHTQM